MASPFDFSSFLLTPPMPGLTTPAGLVDSNSTSQDSNAALPTFQSASTRGTSDSRNSMTQALAVGGPSTFGQQNSGQQQQQLREDNAFLHPSNGESAQHQTFQRQQTAQQQQKESSGSNILNPGLPSSSTRSNMNFDERDYGLDPSAFSSVSFQMPSFLAASTDPGQFGDRPTAVDPSAFHIPPPSNVYQPQNNMSFQQLSRPLGFQDSSTSGPLTSSNAVSDKKRYVPDPQNPIYGIYGSSVISVNPDSTPFKLLAGDIQLQVVPNSRNKEDSRATTPEFDPKSLGLPVGNQLFPQPLPGLYSSSGFDMLGVLARVVARPHPQINIGPVDTSCSFVVVDARRYDMPIVFASETFSKLTGYPNADIIGRNCRFLQAPDGSVTMGSKRKYTDGNAVYHLKTHVQSGKESQASIVNYRKDGSPFINLVTLVPITWDTDEIAYFVGFQVDLVEQPNAILEKMRNGTYVVNYSLLPVNPNPAPTIFKQQDPAGDSDPPLDLDVWQNDQKPVTIMDTIASAGATAAAAQSSMTIAPELLEIMGVHDNGDEIDDDAAKKKWNKMLLDHTGDFVHVLSLKGSFLYVSPSVKSMLEYEPSDLIGKTLQSVCHPSDIVPVMRELKESSTITHPVINLLYRFKRKRSGYIWLEAQGKLYLEQSKSRKCVILVSRERPVYNLSWSDLKESGGLGEREFWSKISLDGIILYNTPTVANVIGHDASELCGSSIFELVDLPWVSELAQALKDAAAGNSVRLQYKLRNAKGIYVDVVTHFHPNHQLKSTTRKMVAGVVQPSIIAQTNDCSSEMRRVTSKSSQTSSLPNFFGGAGSPGTHHSLPKFMRKNTGDTRDLMVTTPEAIGSGDDSGGGSHSGSDRSISGLGSDSSAPSTFSAIPSTYKTLLQHPSLQSNDVFDELDTLRSTSWQYELHQLKLTNKKLKEELHMLQAAKRKKRKKGDTHQAQPLNAVPANSMNATAVVNGPQKNCADCGRTDSPEWRVGPTGSRNLCNACGLRWAKATRGQHQPSNSPSTTPSSMTSDLDTAGSYLHSNITSGPFAPGPSQQNQSLAFAGMGL